MRVISASTSNPRSRLSSWLGVQLVEHRRQRGAARGARLVGDALCGLGQPQPAHPAVVGVDGADEQAIGRELGHQG